MKKIIVAAIVSCALFIAGSSMLINVKDTPSTPKPQLVVDYDPYCNDTAYLETGFTDDVRTAEPHATPIEIYRSEKPLGPDENFLTIKDKETLHSILRPLGVSEIEIALLSDALKPHLRAKDLAAKDHYRYHVLKHKEAFRIDHFVICKIDPYRIPIIYRISRSNLETATFEVSVKAPPVTEKIELVEVTVGQTLYQTFNQIAFGNELMQRLMGVFAWNMRMPQEVLPGDRIEILVHKRYIYDEFIGFGKIKTAVYRQKTRTIAGIFFTSADEKIQGFFDENGKSLEREFAVSPVFETTATSNQKWRLHPVRKIRMHHNGIDYRGSIGTEFYSIADGEIIEKRYDINVGNMIRVQHKYGIHSEYFHADSLADNLYVGGRVKRGQLLGTIGRTGRLCTGPHLHMGLYTMHGEKKKFIELSSLRKTLKPMPNISPAYATEFMRHQKTMLAHIEQQKAPKLASDVRIASPDTK